MSSAKGHLGLGDSADILALEDWGKCWTEREWAQVLASGAERSPQIREATYGGRPLGSAEFVEMLERHLERRLARGAPGRPRKTKVAAAGAEM